MNINKISKLERLLDKTDKGKMKVSVTDRRTQTPVKDAVVQVSLSGDPESVIEQINTDISGETPTIELPAPPVEYSMQPGIEQPYSQYTVKITAPGYENLLVSGSEVFSGQTTLQPVRMSENLAGATSSVIVIPANTLYGDYPPKIPESEVQPVSGLGEIVLSRVVVPEIIVVHDGSPRDSTAKDYYVRYDDYIKNVASSEIYSTWPDETIRANIFAIMSFTLNRVYTEFYRNKGYDFTITSSTAYDHKWVNGRNIFTSISNAVDEIFDKYLSRPNIKQPILTQYCDGKKVSCPNWLSQWGSKYLGDDNYTAEEILKYYYGDTIYINTAEQVQGIPASWPGSDLDIGSSGQSVRQIQEELNLIGDYYNAIPKLEVDGIYGERTAEAVKKFQKIFDMPQSGITDFPTWYQISNKYVALSGIAELV